MKAFISSAILFASLSFSVKANYTIAAQETPLSSLLNIYFNIKNALVSSDANTAANKAGEFVKAVNGIDMKTLPTADMNAFMALQEKLVADAKHISETTAIGQQRAYFQSFSENVYKLAKAVKLSDNPVYQDYCPMKKAYWLSSDAAIKNPYFGSQMLTCGKVNDTIK